MTRHDSTSAAGTAHATTLAELFGDATLPPVAISGLALDSRAVQPGDLFVALRGGTSHGMRYVERALANGAVAVAFEPPHDVPESHVPFVAIANLRARLGELANRFHDAPTRGMTVIGVTGTNGKTSTVQLVAQALAAAGHVVGTIGTLGAGLVGAIREGERTTPDVLATHTLIAGMAKDGATHLAMEVSSHALDQGRVDGIEFDVAVFTNLTRDHLDYHGTLEAYGAAKAKLFAFPTVRTAVINVDDAHGRRLVASLSDRIHRYAYSANGAKNAELRATEVTPSLAGISFTMHAPNGSARIQSKLLGRFNVANLLAVAGCLFALGWSVEDVAHALGKLEPIRGRMSRLGGDGARPLVVVDYAHTPDALDQALASLRAHTDARLVCVFGCGGDRDRGKRPQMAAIAEGKADVVIVTDDNPRTESGDAIVTDILGGFARRDAVRVERDRAKAIALSISLATARDVVLIAGKGHEAYQEVAGVKHPFDDLAVARAALERAA